MTEKIEIKCLERCDEGVCEIEPSICARLNDENTTEENIIFPDYDRFAKSDSFEILSATKLTKIPKFVLTQFTELRQLRLMDAGITTLPDNLFEDMKSQQLQELDLRGNNITEISTDSFAGLSSLEILNLSYNGIARIAPNAFQDCEQLSAIFLSNNQLKEIPPGVFDEAQNLTELCLDSNKLNTIAEKAFNLPFLTILLLRHNQLQSLPQDLCNGIPLLEKIDLSDNQLSEIGSVFDNCNELFSLDLSNNPSIQDADLFDLTNRLSELSYLFLGNVGFKLPDEPPKGIQSDEEYNDRLTHLHLASNQLTNPDILLYLVKFGQLRTLRLHRNDFTHLNHIERVPELFPQLETIDMYHNPRLDKHWIEEITPVLLNLRIHLKFLPISSSE